ncbi:MAG: hypothetical protein M1833_000875 [Piccolia ochrophora]|nr:MAG: hypothetical protein M1833_000875 [Piccolia ochrophora]
MTSVPRQRLQQFSEHLQAPIEDPGTFEDIPKIKKVAPDSTGQRVKGQVIIITGANSPLGIGRATAHQFAQHGALALYLCDAVSTHLPTHARELQSLYPSTTIHTRQLDAASSVDIQAVVDHALTTYNRLDVFFANAGILGTPQAFTDISADDFLNTLRVNTLSCFLAAKHGAPAMRRTSDAKPHPCGSLLFTASVAGLRSNAGSTDYSASKAAVVSLAQTVAWQLAGTGVRANAICPGIIETGMTSAMYEAARARGTERKIGQLNPTRRGAQADEVARVALFLGSEEASYVNGQAWAVCGGLTAGLPVVPGKLA